MKNFKKVISAVVALAMSISSFAAVSASSFTDVADTAVYAEAVDVLSALGIVNGYEEDGVFTFKPEGEITRAEAATMIVGALNMTEEAQAAAGTSQFDDVNTSASWATGYVNVGVAQGFINGMDENTFAPQENVTYAQMCVMLTSIAGFGDYAAANNANSADWSYGYTSMAAATGINKGVAVSKDTALTRGQVAMMIYNTLVTPKLGVAEYSLTGNTYSQLDGKDERDFVTLLSEKFNGYVVTAMITDTPASNGSFDNNEVEFTITKAAWWEETNTYYPNQYNRSVAGRKSYFTKDVDVNSNLFQSGTAVIVYDELDDPYMVYFAPTSKTETREFAADEYVAQADLGSNSYATTDKIRFGSKYIPMNTAGSVYVNLYVNGSLKIGNATKISDAELDKFLTEAQGTIKLIKKEEAVSGTASNGYTDIFVDAYEIAEVTSVAYKNNETIVSFIPMTSLFTNPVRKLTIADTEIEDGDKMVTVMNGDAEIELKDLAEGDIIAIAADFNAELSGDITAKAIEILVSRETVSGKVQGQDSDEETWTIDGKEYSVVGNYANMSLSLGDTYSFTTDPFGRLVKEEMDASSAQFAIVEKVLNDGSVQLVLADGTVKSYDYDSTKVFQADGTTATTLNAIINATGQKWDGTSFGGATYTYKKAPADRVVTYKVKNSTGEISNITQATPTYTTPAGGAEFKGTTSKLGTATIQAATSVIDAQDYFNTANGVAKDYDNSEGQNPSCTPAATNSANDTAKTPDYSVVAARDYGKYSAENFKDGTKYVAAAFKTANASYASLVILTKIGEVFTEDSRFAVLKTNAQQTMTESGDEVYAATVLYEGTEQVFNFENNPAMTIGDAFFFEKDADGIVDSVSVIFALGGMDTFKTTLATSNPATLFAGSTYFKGDVNMGSKYAAYAPGQLDGTWTFGEMFDQGNTVQLFVAPIVAIMNNTVEFAKVDGAANVIDRNSYIAAAGGNGVAQFGISSDAHIYVNDINGNAVKASDKLYASKLTASVISELEYPKNSDKYYTLTSQIIADDTANVATPANFTGLLEYEKCNDVSCTDPDHRSHSNGYALDSSSKLIKVSGVTAEANYNYALVMAVDGDIVCAYEILR